jgi:hypothetical protein
MGAGRVMSDMDRSCAERDAFTSFVLARQTALVRLGWALTGDRQLAHLSDRQRLRRGVQRPR